MSIEDETVVTVKTKYGTVSISGRGSDHTLSEFVDDFIIPALHAMSYHPDLVHEFFHGGRAGEK